MLNSYNRPNPFQFPLPLKPPPNRVHLRRHSVDLPLARGRWP